MQHHLKIRSLYLWFIFALSLIHLIVLSSAGRNPGLILAALPVAYAMHIWFNRKNLTNPTKTILPLIIITLITATIASHLINIVTLESHSGIQIRYRQLQIILLHTLPFAVVFIARKPSLRYGLPAIGLTLQLLPPYSTSLQYTFQIPMYGRIVALLYLCLFIYRKPIRPILFFPAIVAIPTLFYSQSMGNTIDHILLWTIFAVAASSISKLRKTQSRSLIFVILILSILHSIFNLIYPRLYAVNNNIMAMQNETVILASLILIFSLNYIFRIKIILSLLLFLFFEIYAIRVGSETGILTLFLSACIFYSITIIYFKFKQKLQPLLYYALAFGTVAVIFAAIIYITQFNTSHPIISRLFLWRTILNSIVENPQYLIFGTGDFGPYHLFIFRNFQTNLSNAELNILNREPYLLSTDPHNDYLSILYSGGIVLLFVIIFLSIRMFKNSKITTQLVNVQKIESIFLSAIASAFIATILLHGLTEPFTTGATTGFLFFLMFALIQSYTHSVKIKRLKGVSNKRITQIVHTIMVILATYFLTLSTLQLPATNFWRKNGELFLTLRQSFTLPEAIEINETQKKRIQQTLPRLLLLTKLAPWESDYYRQAGDIELLLFLSKSNRNNQELKSAALINYCYAFALRSSPIHYAMIKRISPDLNHACIGISLRQNLSSYDPQHLLDITNENGSPLF